MNPEYIKQCTAAKELQEAWKPENGDRFFAEAKTWHIGNAVIPVVELPSGYFKSVDEPEPTIHVRDCGWGCKEVLIWLPTQEQLWAMLPKRQDSRYFGVVLESGYYTGYLTIPHLTERWEEGYGGYKTLEETLLCMVMFFNHSTVWDSKKGAWV